MTSVRTSLVAGAVAAALGSSSAFAVAPAAGVPANVFYAGGGSAQANAFYVAACKVLGNNADVYTDAAGGGLSGSNYIIYGTLVNAVGGLAAGTPVMYFYKFNGGSFVNGVAPQVGAGAPLNGFQSPAQVIGTAVAVAGRTQGSSCAAGGLPTYTYTPGGLTPQRTDFGLSDLEVAVFKNFNNATGNAGGAAKNTDGGAAPSVSGQDGIYDNLFGVAVTADVYKGGGKNGAQVKTNFSRAEVAGILQGSISDWSQLYDDSGTPLPAGGITFLDRGEGSGSKAAGNQYFLGYPGDGASAQVPFSVNNAYTGTTLTGADPTFVEAAQDIAEGSTNGVISDLSLAQSKHIRAIAVLGMENPPAKNLVGGVNTYYFTKIDGTAVDTGAAGDDINGAVASSYVNAIKGNYDFYYQNSFNTNSALAGQNLANANAFKAAMTAPLYVGADSGLAFPQALPGTLLDADKVVAFGKGVTLNSRKKVSTGPLLPFFDAAAAAAAGFATLPSSSDPL